MTSNAMSSEHLMEFLALLREQCQTLAKGVEDSTIMGGLESRDCSSEQTLSSLGYEIMNFISEFG